MKETNYKVSIIILNWNGKDTIQRCYESVSRQSWNNIEIIIVDNGSDDESCSILEKIITSDVKLIKTYNNHGYSKGMNIGIESSSGDFIIPLNQDVFLHKDFIKNCISVFQKEPDVGLLGGCEKIWKDGELSDEIESVGGFFLKRRIQGITNVTNENGYCFGPHGSFPCIRKNALDEVKNLCGYYYDPMFITGWEDTDLWFRLHWLGWKCYFLNDAIAWHVGSGSVGGKKRLTQKSLDYQQRIFRNRYFVIIKNISLPLFLWLSPSLVLSELLIVPYFLVKSPQSLIALFRAWIDVIGSWNKVFKSRKKIMSHRKLIDNEMKKYFITF